MSLKSPPLTFLPAFESAARLLNFRKAADELHVTPSAVSQQIKQLESLLNEQLFDRSSRNIALTESGQLFYRVAANTLQHYHDELRNFRVKTRNSPVRLTTTPFIASEILIPFMSEFTSQNKSIDLRIETSEEIVDFEQNDCTAAIRIGAGNWQGCKSKLICPMWVTIAGSPALLRERPFDELSDLQNYTLIHATELADHWGPVSEFAGVDLSKNQHMYLDSYISAISAAEKGLGLVVTLLPITKSRVRDNKLQTVLNTEEPTELGFYFVERDDAESNPEIDKLYCWAQDIFEKL